MRYKVYYAHTKDRDIFNITCNPAVDLSYYQSIDGINRIEVITQDMDISSADYIIRNTDKNYSPMQRILLGRSKKNDMLRLQAIKRAMVQLGLKPLKRPEVIDCCGEIPSKESMEMVQDILKGRILSLSQIEQKINKMGMFLKDSVSDILQALYISGKVEIMPYIMIDKPEKGYFCTICGKEFSHSELTNNSKCQGCGSYIQLDEPVFASCHDEEKVRLVPVRYKEHKSLSFPQDRASEDLCTFLKCEDDECLLWMVPGSEDANITSRAIRDMLNRGQRCAVAVSCPRDGEEYRRCIENTFPGTNFSFYQGREAHGNEDIAIIGMEDIRKYYKAFDLIIISEAWECPKETVSCLDAQVKRALRRGGKAVYATSTPDYSMYKRVLKGEVRLVAVPLRNHGKLCPEPRIMTCKALSYDNIFIPSDVMEYIVWSAKQGVRAHIIVPYKALIEQVIELLSSCEDIEKRWLWGANPLIFVTTPKLRHIHVAEEENVIVLFADENSVFDEKALIDAAGLAGRINIHGPGEVLFVGTIESDEMYNAKHMMRFINKSAWEMGYLK